MDRGTDPCPGHFVNSYDQDGITVVDVCQGKKGPFPFFFPDVQGNMFDPADMATYLTRWHIDPDNAATPVRVERLDDVICEFPQIDARLEMARHRHGYFVVMNAGMPAGRLLEAPGVPPVIPDGEPDLVLSTSGFNGIGP